jgi:hypothetical protein
LLTLSGCGDCISLGGYALAVSAIDARTHSSILPGSTIIVAHDGVRDSITVRESLEGSTVGVGGSKAGTFSVTVRKNGYTEATQTDIHVGNGHCGLPETANVSLALTPQL